VIVLLRREGIREKRDKYSKKTEPQTRWARKKCGVPGPMGKSSLFAVESNTRFKRSLAYTTSFKESWRPEHTLAMQASRDEIAHWRVGDSHRA
jgi:hypothetical protein